MAVTKIYTLSDPFTDKVRYVGRTNQPKIRLYNHIRSANILRKTKNHAWINSVISKGGKPIMHIIDECESENYAELEMFYISLFKGLGFNLTNLTDGGDGSLGRPATDENKKKMSNFMKGNNYAIGSTHKRKCVYTTVNGNIMEFKSITNASEQLGIPRRAISNNVNGWSNSTHGLKFYTL
jgi:hypothetical protein